MEQNLSSAGPAYPPDYPVSSEYSSGIRTSVSNPLTQFSDAVTSKKQTDATEEDEDEDENEEPPKKRGKRAPWDSSCYALRCNAHLRSNIARK